MLNYVLLNLTTNVQYYQWLLHFSILEMDLLYNKLVITLLIHIVECLLIVQF